MPLNPTENYLRDRRDHVLINFQGTVTTSDRYLNGPCGYAGDGYPMPAPGKVIRLYVYDGSYTRVSAVASAFSAGDRLSVLAEYDAPWFQDTVQINGVNSNTYVNQVSANSTHRVSVFVRLDVY